MLEVSVKKILNSAEGKLELDLDFQCQAGEFLVISGESGAGKTSLLRMIAGLMNPDSGNIIFNQEPLGSIVATSLNK